MNYIYKPLSKNKNQDILTQKLSEELKHSQQMTALNERANSLQSQIQLLSKIGSSMNGRQNVQ